MSDVNRYVVRVKCVPEERYASFRSTLSKTIQHPGWIVEQVSFIAGVQPLYEEELKKNIEFFKVPKVHPLLTLAQSDSLQKLGNTKRGRRRRTTK